MGRQARAFIFALGLAAGAAPALAQSTDAPLPDPAEADGTMFTIGAGAGLNRDYEGSNDYRLIPVAFARGSFNGISFSTKGLALQVDLLTVGSERVEFNAGPIIGLRLNRTGKIKDDVVDLLPERDTAIEVGGFAGVSFKQLTNPYDSLSFTVDVLKDVAGAHQSTIVSPGVSFSTPLSRFTYASVSLGADFVGDGYADYYFSVSPAASLASGLPAFDADGGMKNWKAGLLLNQAITGDLLGGFSLFGLANYARLRGDFKDSPIVSIRGSASQWLLAGGVAYTF